MVNGVSGSQNNYNINQTNGNITYAQAQQVAQNLQNYINGLVPNSGQYIYASELLEQIQGCLSAGPNSFNGSKMLQDIQLGLNYTNSSGQDIYLSSLEGCSGTLPSASQSQIESMLSQIFSSVQPTPTFSVPAPTIADTTFANIMQELQQIPQTGPDEQFSTALEKAMNGMTSGMSESSLYNQLEGIPTTGVDPSIVAWFNNLLAGLQPSK